MFAEKNICDTYFWGIYFCIFKNTKSISAKMNKFDNYKEKPYNFYRNDT